MKKVKKETVFFNKYMATLDEIEDSMFSQTNLCECMRLRYKNAKKENTGTSLWRKNANVYILIHGQQGYNEMVASLLPRMARMGEEDSREIRISTPVSVGYSQISERLAAEDDNNSSH